METQTAIDLIVKEFNKASEKFPDFNSAHEGYAVLLEEVEKLWDEIKVNNDKRFAPEAVQAGAMCLRFLVNICEPCNKKIATEKSTCAYCRSNWVNNRNHQFCGHCGMYFSR